MDFVFGAVGADPGDEVLGGDGGGRDVLQPGDEGVVGDVLDEFDAGGAEFGALERFERAGELDEIEAGGGGVGFQIDGEPGAAFRGGGVNKTVAQADGFGGAV